MKFTGTYNGKPIELELTEEQVKSLRPKRKKTGWERVKKEENYWVCNTFDRILEVCESSDCQDDDFFSHANYFSDATLVRNIIRAQTLQRKLWRRSAELCENAGWNNDSRNKVSICHDYNNRCLCVCENQFFGYFGQIYFDTKEHAEKVMNEFHDELIWYFTEFKSRMD